MSRWVIILLASFGLAFAAQAVASMVAPAIADAQPTGRQPQTVQVKTADPQFSKVSPHGDLYETKPTSKQPGMALLFWAFAAATIGGALFVITRRNLIAAVMGMVGSFLGISAVYMMLYARFLSVIQMLVYAGAIMVLFVFVIMILNRPEDEPVAPTGRAGQAIGGLAIVYLVFRLVMLLINVKPPATSLDAPAQVALAPIGAACVEGSCGSGFKCAAGHCAELVDWGSVKSDGSDLFGAGIFPFEAISILLLVAVVGAIAVARPLREAGTEDEGGQA